MGWREPTSCIMRQNQNQVLPHRLEPPRMQPLKVQPSPNMQNVRQLLQVGPRQNVRQYLGRFPRDQVQQDQLPPVRVQDQLPGPLRVGQRSSCFHRWNFLWFAQSWLWKGVQQQTLFKSIKKAWYRWEPHFLTMPGFRKHLVLHPTHCTLHPLRLSHA